MRFVEISKLNDFINATRDFIKNNDVQGIFSAINTQNLISLQGESLLSDRDHLKELESLLNVIVSIINHPHIANKGEEVVLRVEQANALSNDEFRQVLRDSKLWKRHGARMIPEEVHYHQQIDELRIYENRFIAFLIDMVERELISYSTFYLTKLPTMGEDTKYLSSGEIGDIIITVDRLRRKIQFIKGTYFYKVVSEGNSLFGKIQPTNILTKDRLYKYCFKFYRKFISHDDKNTLSNYLRIYYVLCILKELSDVGFTLDSGAKKSDVVLRINREELNVSFELYQNDAVIVRVNAEGIPESSHLLIFVEDSARSVANSYDVSAFSTVETISLWELASVTDVADKICASEKSLVHIWLKSKLTMARIDRRIYEKYCPVCRARGVDSDGVVYRCNSCLSEYAFIGGTDTDKVWFRKIRK